MLSTDITAIAFAQDADHIIQLTNTPAPSAEVWTIQDSALTIVDRSQTTCASALISGHLADIKAFCRYSVHKPAFPRGIIKLYGNTFLFITVARDSGRLLYFGRVIYFFYFFSVHQIFDIPGPIFAKLYHTTRYVLK